MRLPEELFNQILSALNPEQPAPADGGGAAPAGGAVPAAAAEREWKRRAVRRRVSRRVWYVRHGAPDHHPQVGTVVDISKVGLGILLDAVAAPGERLIVHLPCAAPEGYGAAARTGEQVVTVLCTVRTCRIRADGQFRVGAEFSDPASARWDAAPIINVEGLVGLGEPDPEAVGRRSERVEADGRAMMYLYRGGRQAPLERVPVADYSEHGVAILRGEPLEVGEEFVIRVPRAEEKPITRLCRVANVAPYDGRYRIGAEFVPFRGRGLLSRLRDWIA